jgi:hypothetical protein
LRERFLGVDARYYVKKIEGGQRDRAPRRALRASSF